MSFLAGYREYVILSTNERSEKCKSLKYDARPYWDSCLTLGGGWINICPSSGKNRIEAAVDGDENVWALAGKKDTGETAVLVSCFKSASPRVAVSLEGGTFTPDNVRVSVLDAGHDLTLLKEVEVAGNDIILNKPAGSTVFLVELQ